MQITCLSTWFKTNFAWERSGAIQENSVDTGSGCKKKLNILDNAFVYARDINYNKGDQFWHDKKKFTIFENCI